MGRALTLRWKSLTFDLELDPKPLQTAVLLKLLWGKHSATPLATLPEDLLNPAECPGKADLFIKFHLGG